MQFAWYFRYPGPDGKYGATSVKLMDPSAGGEAAVGLEYFRSGGEGRCGHGHDVSAGGSRGRSEFAVGGCDPQLFCAFVALQAGCGAWTEHSHAFQADGRSASTKLPAPNSAAWGITKCTAWYTSSARKISTSGWRHGRRRNNKWRPRLRFTRTLLRVSFENTFSASITKSLASNISFWRSRRCLSGCFCRC